MTLKQYLSMMTVSTFLCWVAFGFVLFQIDPFVGGAVGFTFFYLSLFFALLGTASIVAFIFYHFTAKKDIPMYRYVKKGFRDGISTGAVVVGLLYLQAHNLLNFWNLVIFCIIIFLIIAFSVSTQSGQSGL